MMLTARRGSRPQAFMLFSSPSLSALTAVRVRQQANHSPALYQPTAEHNHTPVRDRSPSLNPSREPSQNRSTLLTLTVNQPLLLPKSLLSSNHSPSVLPVARQEFQ